MVWPLSIGRAPSAYALRRLARGRTPRAGSRPSRRGRVRRSRHDHGADARPSPPVPARGPAPDRSWPRGYAARQTLSIRLGSGRRRREDRRSGWRRGARVPTMPTERPTPRPAGATDPDAAGEALGAALADGACRRGRLLCQETAVAAEQAVEEDPDEDHDAADHEVPRRPVGHVDGTFRGGRGACGGGGGPSASSASGRGGGTRTGGGARTGCCGGGDLGRVGLDPRLRVRFELGLAVGLGLGRRVRSRAQVPARAPGRTRAPVRARTPGRARAPARIRRQRPPRSGPRRPSRAPTSRRIRSRRRAPRARRDRRAPPPACPRVVRSWGSSTPRGRLGHGARRGRQCTEGAEAPSASDPSGIAHGRDQETGQTGRRRHQPEERR